MPLINGCICDIKLTGNPFSANISLLYSLKTSENLRLSDIFRRYRSGTLVKNVSFLPTSSEISFWLSNKYNQIANHKSPLFIWSHFSHKFQNLNLLAVKRLSILHLVLLNTRGKLREGKSNCKL